MEHDGFSLYETVAITRYVDEAFPGPALMPSDVKRRARVAQVFSVLDSYGWQPMVITVFVQRVVMPMRGGKPDQGAIDAALPQAGQVLAAVEELTDGGEFLVGGALSLADLHLRADPRLLRSNEGRPRGAGPPLPPVSVVGADGAAPERCADASAPGMTGVHAALRRGSRRARTSTVP